MTQKLADGLTESCGGLYTGDVAHLLGVSKAAAWRMLRDLEVKGLLEGCALDRHGDLVGRTVEGHPARPGAEIKWLAATDDKAGEIAQALSRAV